METEKQKDQKLNEFIANNTDMVGLVINDFQKFLKRMDYALWKEKRG